jgi:hypothetical protein
MKIDCTVTDTGVVLHVEGRQFALNFPRAVWQVYPHKELFADNYAYLKALHLPQMLERRDGLDFATSYPMFRSQIQWAMLNNIPFCADVDRVPAAPLIRDFLALDTTFRDHDTRFVDDSRPAGQGAVLNMSFGKDSLLTYAVAREIGLPLTLVMSVDNDCPLEYGYKADIARRFSEEFGETLHPVENGAGVIHRYEYWGSKGTEWGFGHLITEYCMYAVPFAYRDRRAAILLGNEKSCDDFYTGRDGLICYPVFDQSSTWQLEMSKLARAMTGAPLHVMSLIEPLHDVAIIKILHERYPEIAKYQMSCFPDENEHGKRHYWCGHCSKCGRVFTWMKAHGLDPRSVGLDTDMFGAGFAELFQVFGAEWQDGKTVGYDATPCGRDEQLFALYLALQNGARGALMDRFRNERLAEAESRAAELQQRFMTVQDTRALPEPYARKVKAIYREALEE